MTEKDAKVNSIVKHSHLRVETHEYISNGFLSCIFILLLRIQAASHQKMPDPSIGSLLEEIQSERLYNLLLLRLSLPR